MKKPVKRRRKQKLSSRPNWKLPRVNWKSKSRRKQLKKKQRIMARKRRKKRK